MELEYVSNRSLLSNYGNVCSHDTGSVRVDRSQLAILYKILQRLADATGGVAVRPPPSPPSHPSLEGTLFKVNELTKMLLRLLWP